MRYVFICATLFFSYGCSYFQAAGMLNDRGEDYQQAQAYENNLQDSAVWQFSDSYPIPEIASSGQDAPTELERPALSFIADEYGKGGFYLSSYKSNAAVNLIVGRLVNGEIAILVRDKNRLDVVQNALKQVSFTPIDNANWRGTFANKEISVELNSLVKSLILVIKEAKETQDDDDFVVITQADQTTLDFTSQLMQIMQADLQR